MLIMLLSLVNEEDKHILLSIYEKYRGVMMAAAMAIVHDPVQAEDIVQDAFIRIIEKMHLLKEVSCNGLRSYTVLIVRSVAMNKIDRQNRRKTQPLDEVEFRLKDEEWTIEDRIVQKEQISVIRQCLSNMDMKYSYPMILRYYYGFSDSETAELLDIPSTNTVRSRCHRGKKMILDEMKKRGDLADES